MTTDKAKNQTHHSPDDDGRRGWDVIKFDAVKRPPKDFAAFVYVLCTLILVPLIAFALLSSFRFAYETLTGELRDRVDVAKVFFPVIVALIGGPILIWRALTAHWSAQAAGRQAETGQEAHFTSLFTKAVEQLGTTREVTKIKMQVSAAIPASESIHTVTETEPNLEVRLGAIYALERVAEDSERDHWPIMEVLCSYVRNPQNCGVPTSRPEDALPILFDSTSPRGNKQYLKWIESIADPRTDIQAALTVIGRRPNDRVLYEEERKVNLDFRRANLQRAMFRGNFSRAQFDDAVLDAASCSFADLRDSSFSRTLLAEADLFFAKIDNSTFSRAVMFGIRLAKTEVVSVSFDESHLERADFTGAKLTRCYFEKANLTSSRFFGATLREVNFRESLVRECNFTGAKLYNVNFSEVTLYASQFENAKFESVAFIDAKLEGASFFGSDLSNAKGLSTEQLSSCLGDASTILPETIARPSDWPTKTLSQLERVNWMRKARSETRYKSP